MAYMCVQEHKECNGCGACKNSLVFEEIEPECVICGSKKCDYFYFNREGEPVGCDDCIRREDVW